VEPAGTVKVVADAQHVQAMLAIDRLAGAIRDVAGAAHSNQPQAGRAPALLLMAPSTLQGTWCVRRERRMMPGAAK
jgi:hypothetical protein